MLWLTLALLVNAAIMVLAASAFHRSGHHDVDDIAQACSLASRCWPRGRVRPSPAPSRCQVIMEGFLDLKIPCWQRRLITRALALVPAFIGIWWFGGGRMIKALAWLLFAAITAANVWLVASSLA